MSFLIAYIIKSIVASGILFAWYMVALRNRKFHVYNRIYLLSAATISLILPFANFKCFNHPISIISFSPAAHHSFPLSTAILIAGMAMISLFLLTVMILKIGWIYRVKRVNGHVRLGDIDFVETRIEKAPFSFLNNLFWRENMPTTDGNGKRIFLHEMTHIRQRHTYDKLFIQIITCICWMNPFYWLIQKELNVVHEFMADETAVEEGDTEAFAMMLLQCHDQGRYLDPSHYFSQSPVIRRLNMIAASNNIPYRHARKFLALPLIALLLVLFSYKVSVEQDSAPAMRQIEREQKLLDEKRAQENPKVAMTYSAHTFFIRYRYRTFM